MTSWPSPVALAMHERRERAQGGEHRGAEVDIGRGGLGGRAGFARDVHGARHGLAYAIEAAAMRIGPRSPKAV